jgi:hypothetical protein
LKKDAAMASDDNEDENDNSENPSFENTLGKGMLEKAPQHTVIDNSAAFLNPSSLQPLTSTTASFTEMTSTAGDSSPSFSFPTLTSSTNESPFQFRGTDKLPLFDHAGDATYHHVLSGNMTSFSNQLGPTFDTPSQSQNLSWYNPVFQHSLSSGTTRPRYTYEFPPRYLPQIDVLVTSSNGKSTKRTAIRNPAASVVFAKKAAVEQLGFMTPPYPPRCYGPSVYLPDLNLHLSTESYLLIEIEDDSGGKKLLDTYVVTTDCEMPVDFIMPTSAVVPIHKSSSAVFNYDLSSSGC